MTSGPVLFCRFAFPPSSLGYCGPSDTGLLGELLAGREGVEEMNHAAGAFAGAWPYLELIGGCAGKDPLDYEVVEAYWLGNALLERIDLQTMGHSVAERFRARAGRDWSAIDPSLGSTARPTHSFHVFCVYPWVGMLRSGAADQALEVLDRCRIRWGTVTGGIGSDLIVSSRLLAWDGRSLGLGPATSERVRRSPDGSEIGVGDLVAMHWDYVCQRITERQRRHLERYQALHVGFANATGRRLAARIER